LITCKQNPQETRKKGGGTDGSNDRDREHGEINITTTMAYVVDPSCSDVLMYMRHMLVEGSDDSMHR
jgi:hypothetical protein